MPPGSQETILRVTGDATLPMRDAVERAIRSSSKWCVLALHLSRLAPPAPKPHHTRIARAVLDDAASVHGGQLFTLASGDLALFFRPPDGGIGLSAALANLFAADMPDSSLLLSRWPIPGKLGEFVAFLDAVPAMAVEPKKATEDCGLAAVTRLFESLEPRRIRDLLRRQTGVLVNADGTGRVAPVFRAVSFSVPALEASAAAVGHVTTDPYLLRHLIAKLDDAMLAAVTSDLEHGRPLAARLSGGSAGKPGTLALHVHMSPEAVLSPVFTRLVEIANQLSVQIAVEIALLEVFADTESFVTARARVADAGFTLALDEVSHQAFLVSNPAELDVDCLKLDWSRQMLQAGEPLDAAIAAFGPGRLVLRAADTEEALRWGLARNIRRFQGRHTDAILAASRLSACPGAPACTLRKCVDRESGITAASRAECTNHDLLDQSIAAPELVR